MKRITSLAKPKNRRCKNLNFLNKNLAMPNFMNLDQALKEQDTPLKLFEFDKLKNIYLSQRRVRYPRYIMKNNLAMPSLSSPYRNKTLGRESYSSRRSSL